MNRSVTLYAFVAITAPALAGGPPMSAFENTTTSTASVNADAMIDPQSIPTPFGVTNSAATVELFNNGVLRNRGQASTDFSVTDQTSFGGGWRIQMSANASAFSNDGNAASAMGEAFYSSTFLVRRTRVLDILGSFNSAAIGSDQTVGQASFLVNVFREDMLVDSIQSAGEELNDIIMVFAPETINAMYTVEMSITASASSFGATGGLNSTAQATGGLRIEVVPAPMTAAPLAIGGLLVARRRRA